MAAVSKKHMKRRDVSSKKDGRTEEWGERDCLSERGEGGPAFPPCFSHHVVMRIDRERKEWECEARVDAWKEMKLTSTARRAQLPG